MENLVCPCWFRVPAVRPGLHALTGLQVNVREFEPQRLFMLSIYLIVMGLLLGYLAEQQKHLRAEKAVVTGTLSRVRVEAGLNGNDAADLQRTMSMYGASRLLVASQEKHSQRVFVGELSNRGRSAAGVPLAGIGAARRENLSEDFPGDVCCAWPAAMGKIRFALDAAGQPDARTGELRSISQLREVQEFDAFITVAFHFGASGEAGYLFSILTGAARPRRNCDFCWI